MRNLDNDPAQLAGVFPVFQTPYKHDESIDYEVLETELNWLYDQGCAGVVMAMVSEVLRLSEGERRELAAFVCSNRRSGRGVIISVGAESSRTAVMYARHAEDAGATALMAIPPVAVALGEQEVYEYFRRILSAVELPVVVQDASGYVGQPLPISLYVRLLGEFGDRVLFKPEATPIGPRLSALRDATDGRARVFEGTGGIALVDSFRRGIVGTMPGADLIRGVTALWQALQGGDAMRITAISLPLIAIVSLQNNLDAFLAIEKHLLVRQGIFRNTLVRRPVGFILDDETRQEVDRLFDILVATIEELAT